MKAVKKLLLVYMQESSKELRNSRFLQTGDHNERKNLSPRKKESTDVARPPRKIESSDVTRSSRFSEYSSKTSKSISKFRKRAKRLQEKRKIIERARENVSQSINQ